MDPSVNQIPPQLSLGKIMSVQKKNIFLPSFLSRISYLADWSFAHWAASHLVGRLPHFDRVLAVWSDRLSVPGEFAVEISKRDNKEKEK